MIYLSAQPDDYYFLWQLQLQIFNFHSLGIQPQNIHILIGFNPLKGLNPEFYNWIKGNADAMFFTYADERVLPTYLSSIRSHIIAKHFEAYPYLQEDTVFYHDSDIIFRCLPDFQGLIEGENWYTSDTRSYLDTNYLINIANEVLLKQMCDIVGIPVNAVKAQDHNAGGAQYLIKNCPLSFWKKLGKDSENLYRLMEDYNNSQYIKGEENPKVIQSWCADMWAFWWNALVYNKNFVIHPELDFVWADSSIEQWNSKKILHYSGDISKKRTSVFRKGDFAYYDPFYTLFSQLDQGNASYALKNVIDEYRQIEESKRINFSDVTFLLITAIDSEEHLENLYITVNYLTKWFETIIYVIELGERKQVDLSQFIDKPKHLFIEDESSKLQFSKKLNDLIQELDTPIISFYATGIVLPISQAELAVNKLRNQDVDFISVDESLSMRVDRLSKAMFLKTLDPAFFDENQGKYKSVSKFDNEGLLFINRQYYLDKISDSDYPALITNLSFTSDKRLKTEMVNCNSYWLPGNGTNIKTLRWGMKMNS
jgi:hypothetical protein